MPSLVARHRVDREVAALEVVLQRHVGRGEELEAAIAAAVLALGARERVFLVRVRMQEHREVLADGHVARGEHHLGRGADHHPVAVGDRAAEQLVAHRAADAVDGVRAAAGDGASGVVARGGPLGGRSAAAVLAEHVEVRRDGLGRRATTAPTASSDVGTRPNTGGKGPVAHVVARHRQQVVAAHQPPGRISSASACSRAAAGRAR